jgi:hypothetical protein
MKSRIIFPAAALALLTSSLLQAGDSPVVTPKGAVTLQPESSSRFSVGVGILTRNISADFNLSSPGQLNTNGLFKRGAPSGKGDVGLFTGGYNKVYDDGSVGPGYQAVDGNTADGTAYGTIASPSQVTNSGRNLGGKGNDPIYDLRFHSTGTAYDYATQYKGNSAHSGDKENGFGPYVEFRYAAIQGKSTGMNLLLGYSWVSADLGSGKSLLATESVFEKKTTQLYTYRYDFHATASYDINGKHFLDGGVSFPYWDSNSYIIYDSNTANADGGYTDTSKSSLPANKTRTSRTTASRIATFYATGNASLDVDFHEIVLAPEFSFQPCSKVRIGLSVGPTLNFINTDFTANAAWYQTGSNKALATYHLNENHNALKLGVAAQLSVIYDITKSIYFEASASYRYVPTEDVKLGFAHTSLDTSAWQSALGLGYRF